MEGESKVVIVEHGKHHVSVFFDEKEKCFTFEVTLVYGREDTLSLTVVNKPSQKRQQEMLIMQEEEEKNKTDTATIDMLPAEIMQNILAVVCEDRVMRVVCRSVCRVWRELTLSLRLKYGVCSPLEPASAFAAHAISQGWISILRWAMIEHGCIWGYLAFVWACRSGDVEVLKLVRNHKHYEKWKSIDTYEISEHLGRGGRMDAIQWLIDDGFCLDWQSLVDHAAAEGHIHILQWSFDRVPFIRNTFLYAAEKGCIESMKWMKENDKNGFLKWKDKVFFFIAASGNLEALKWARANGCPWNEVGFAEVLRLGKMDCVSWLKDNGCPWTGRATKTAFYESPKLEILKWARENGYTWNGKKMSKKAIDFETIKWLKEEGGGGWYPSARVLHVAVTSKDIENVRWAIENGCPMGWKAISLAAKIGNLEIMKYLRGMGCDWRQKRLFIKAANAGNLEMLQWLKDQGCRWGNVRRLATDNCTNLAALQWLVAAGCPLAPGGNWDPVCLQRNDVVKWLIEMGLLKWEDRMFEERGDFFDVDMLDWLKARGLAPTAHRSFTHMAAKGNHLQALQWCRENGIEWTKETLIGALEARSPAALRFVLTTHPDVKQMLVDPWCQQTG